MEAAHNPAEVEASIRECANRIAKSVTICGERYDAWKTAERAYDTAFAKAYLDATGSIKDRTYKAELETAELREAMDVADAAYRFADRTAKAVESELRAWQSVGASIRAMFGVAGRGEY